MLYHARESNYRGDVAAPPESGFDRFYTDGPACSDDPALTIAYAISDLAITFLGPIFWVLLASLFVIDEFGH